MEEQPFFFEASSDEHRKVGRILVTLAMLFTKVRLKGRHRRRSWVSRPLPTRAALEVGRWQGIMEWQAAAHTTMKLIVAACKECLSRRVGKSRGKLWKILDVWWSDGGSESKMYVFRRSIIWPVDGTVKHVSCWCPNSRRNMRKNRESQAAAILLYNMPGRK